MLPSGRALWSDDDSICCLIIDLLSGFYVEIDQVAGRPITAKASDRLLSAAGLSVRCPGRSPKGVRTSLSHPRLSCWDPSAPRLPVPAATRVGRTARAQRATHLLRLRPFVSMAPCSSGVFASDVDVMR